MSMTKPTMDDVARRAGVSRALVSLAMRGSEKVSATSRTAVMAAADELGYRPNLIARHLASKQTRTFGLLINDLHNPYFPRVVDGVKRAADARGYRLLLNSAFLDDRHERHALDTFVDFNVDGIILTGARVEPSVIERAARSVPVVVVSRPMRSPNIDTVNNDDKLGATLAIEHLIGLGHEHICHIDGGKGAGARQRRAGYESTMRAHGLLPFVVSAAFTESSGARAAEVALGSRRPITAIFAGNDLSALGALDTIEGNGLTVPHDISLVGYDNTFVAALRHVALTSVDQGREQLGELAVEALIDRIEGGRTHAVHHVIPPTLVVRNTTAPPKPR
jgi:DNA-binding LacI/PurR family transcriptional regulator